MQFNSLTFVLFFAIVVALYFALSSWAARKTVLVVASYAFYAAWNPLYVALLWISTIADWYLGRRIAASTSRGRRRLLLAASLAVNLGLLGYFKYGQFLLDNSITLLAAIGIDYRPPDVSIVLPVGISFYTFQTLSYTLDIYRGRLRPQFSLRDFALFVAFFPQLVAGPIVRASDFLPQCREPKRFSQSAFGWGVALMVFGLFAKIVLADGVLAPVADAVFAQPTAVGTFEAWLGVFAFSGQIFFDFSGYSTCAIGAALCMGFALPDNFRAPYAALGFSDFWRRWHISLSQWLRDYLYISLGGNRHGTRRTFVNLVITMFLGGLWHGASWMFVIWGLLHGLYLVVEHAVTTLLAGRIRLTASLSKFGVGLLTFTVVSATWVFFRSPDMTTANTMLARMFSVQETVSVVFAEQLPALLAVIVGLIGWHWLTRTRTLEEIFGAMPAWPRAMLIALAALGIVYHDGGAEHAFIYFQF
jgi:D-alanyl-lipoteichoic acid acyltransferase DltB (MBOAT superfamily)